MLAAIKVTAMLLAVLAIASSPLRDAA